jgi:hypothetical protein
MSRRAAIVSRQHIWIPGPLPGANEALGACRQSRGKGSAYSKLKAQWTGIVEAIARKARAQRTAPLLPVNRASFRFNWCELVVGRKRGRDPDNIDHGIKYVLDGLVAAGVLPGDTRKSVGERTHRTIPVATAQEVGVLVEIVEGEE